MLPAISVVVTTHNQSEALRRHLPQILEQEYAGGFEVIVVDINSTDDTLTYLESLEGTYTNLRVISTPDSARNISKLRMALTLAFRTANNEWVMVTLADCEPSSPHWLTSMGKACQSEETMMVLGYTRYADGKGWLWLRYHFMRIWQQMLHLQWTKTHPAYRCDGTNLCYRRSFFLNHKGFADDSNLQLGATDIMVNHNSTLANTQYVACPEAIVMQDTPRYYRKWLQERTFFMETRRHFHNRMAYCMHYLREPLLTWVPTILMLTTMVWGIMNGNIVAPIAVFTLWLALIAYQTYRINKQFAAMGEQPIWGVMPLLLHLVLVWDIGAWLSWLFTNRQTFQKKYI